MKTMLLATCRHCRLWMFWTRLMIVVCILSLELVVWVVKIPMATAGRTPRRP